MTIASVINRVGYTGNGSVSTYSYTFRIFQESDLLVTIRDTDDVETTLALTTDYTVSGVGDQAGGSISLVNSLQSWLNVGSLKNGFILTIRRVVDLTQETDLRNQGEFFPESHEDEFDKLTMVDQQQQDQINGSFRLPETIDPADVSTVLPIPVAGRTIGWNATADGLINFANAGDLAVSSFIESLLDDTTAAIARATLDASQLILSRPALTAPATGDLVGVTDISASNAETKMTLANLLKVINVLTADTSPAVDDVILTYDTSAASVKGVTKANFEKATTAAKTNSNNGTTVSGAVKKYTADTTTAFGQTLPDCATNAGLELHFKKISSDFNLYTLTAAGTDTIQDSGAAAATTNLATQGEEFSIVSFGGTVWQVFNRKIPGDRRTYTPVFTGLGTVTNASAEYYRIGSYLHVRGFVTSGTAAGSLASISLPTGLSIGTVVPTNTTAASGLNIGDYTQNATGNLGAIVSATGTSLLLVYFGVISGGTNHLIPQNGSSVSGNAADTAFKFSINIANWNG